MLRIPQDIPVPMFLRTAAVWILLGIYLIYRFKRRRLAKLIEQFPGLPGYPLLGNALEVIGTSSVILQRSEEVAHTYTSPSRIWLFHQPLLIVYDPENFQIISNKVLNKGILFSFVKQLLGNGLLTIDDKEVWRKHRRLLNPVASLKVMGEYYLKIFHSMNNRLIEDFDKVADTGQKVNVWRFIFEREYSKIFKAITGYDVEQEEKKYNFIKFAKCMKLGSQRVIARIYKPWLYPETINKIHNQLTGGNKIFEGMRELPQKIIQERLIGMKDGNESFSDSGKEKKNKILIDVLTDPESAGQYNEREMVDEIITFLDAGSVTTSSGVCYTLLMLAMHQFHLDHVYREIQEVLGDKDVTEWDLATLDKLVFLEQCIKESLRIFPPVPHILRYTDEDLMSKDGRIIPSGTVILLSILSLHRNQDVYSSPEVWDPDRFGPQEIAKRHPYSFAPFGAGPRTCLGYKYAYLSMKAQLAALLQRYHFTTELNISDIKLSFDTVLRNLTGHQVKVYRRTHTRSKQTANL